MRTYYLRSMTGACQKVTMTPQATGIKEKFAVWVFRKLAPRFTYILRGDVLDIVERAALEEEWEEVLAARPENRVEDIYRVQVEMDEETGGISGL